MRDMEKYRYEPNVMASMEASPIPFAVYQFVDRRVVTLVLSAGFCKLFGYEDRAQAYHDMDHDMYRDAHPHDAARIAEAALRFATEGGKYEVVYRTKTRKSSGYRIIHATGEHICTETGARLAYIWYTDEGAYAEEDDTRFSELDRAFSRDLHQQSLLWKSHFDYLTGLPGMTYFFELANEGRKRLYEQGELPTLLFIDLSGIKYYNRKHGFEEGNKLLRAFAKLLAKYFSNENCSRLGQDHFAVYTAAAGLEDRLTRLFKENETINDGCSLPVRVGIYLDETGQTDISAACDRAKFACDIDRKLYRSMYRYFNDAMLTNVRRRQYIIDNLGRAIDEQWISVYYQPIVRTANGRVCDEEALARWIDPAKGMISPADFIPILEEARLVYKVDLYVLERVLEKLKVQSEAGLYIVPQSINLSRSDFDACDIVEEIRRRVDDAGIGRDKLNIEITESMVGSDFQFMKEQVGRFRELGFNVWMDDFGSGYSSLDVLQSLRFDLIKFDMRFMQQFNGTDKSKIILAELMKMALGLGIETVAEGVETREQLEFLREVGCTKVQGFFYGKPIPLGQILRRYEQGRQIGLENPEESDYYAAIGRINLYDPALITDANMGDFEYYFNTIPMAILEVREGKVRIVRCNQSYRDFLTRYLDLRLPDGGIDNTLLDEQPGESFFRSAEQCRKSGDWVVLSDLKQREHTIYAFLRWVSENPVTGAVALASVVLAMMG